MSVEVDLRGLLPPNDSLRLEVQLNAWSKTNTLPEEVKVLCGNKGQASLIIEHINRLSLPINFSAPEKHAASMWVLNLIA